MSSDDAERDSGAAEYEGVEGEMSSVKSGDEVESPELQDDDGDEDDFTPEEDDGDSDYTPPEQYDEDDDDEDEDEEEDGELGDENEEEDEGEDYENDDDGSDYVNGEEDEDDAEEDEDRDEQTFRKPLALLNPNPHRKRPINNLPSPKKPKRRCFTMVQKAYFERLYDEHIKPLSNAKGLSMEEVFRQWYFMEMEDLEEPQYYEDCNCEKENIRYKFHIRNRKTGQETFFGSNCIDHFLAKRVKNVIMAMFKKGIIGRFIGQRGEAPDTILKFEINPQTGIVKHREVFESTFSESTPLEMPRDADAKPVLRCGIDDDVIEYGVQPDVATMEVGKSYRIRVRLFTANDGQILQAAIVDFKRPKKPPSIGPEVRQFLR